MVDRGGAPPEDMGAEVDHDGVIWRISGRRGLQVASVAGLVGLVLGGLVVGPYGILGALVLAAVPLLVFAQASRSSTIRVTLRWVVVETRDLFGRTTCERVPLDEIREVRVASSQAGDWALVIGAGGSRYHLAPRSRREHLEWLRERIEQARALFADHERREGREWSFLRKVPDDLDDLLQLSTDERDRVPVTEVQAHPNGEPPGRPLTKP